MLRRLANQHIANSDAWEGCAYGVVANGCLTLKARFSRFASAPKPQLTERRRRVVHAWSTIHIRWTCSLSTVSQRAAPKSRGLVIESQEENEVEIVLLAVSSSPRLYMGSYFRKQRSNLRISSRQRCPASSSTNSDFI